jgi:hypothetical protein
VTDSTRRALDASASSDWARIQLTRAVLAHLRDATEIRRDAATGAMIAFGWQPWFGWRRESFDSLLLVGRRALAAGETGWSVEIADLLTISRPESQASWRLLARARAAAGDNAGAKQAARKFEDLTGDSLPDDEVADGILAVSTAVDAEIARMAAGVEGNVAGNEVLSPWIEGELLLDGGASMAQALPYFASSLTAARADADANNDFQSVYDALSARVVATGSSLEPVAGLWSAVTSDRPRRVAAYMDPDASTQLAPIDVSGLRQYLAGKRVCLVANSARLLDHEVGEEIDAYDVVVRFNSFAL